MNDAARLLRAQKSYSTDPDYLERMACAAESRGADTTHNASAEELQVMLTAKGLEVAAKRG